MVAISSSAPGLWTLPSDSCYRPGFTIWRRIGNGSGLGTAKCVALLCYFFLWLGRGCRRGMVLVWIWDTYMPAPPCSEGAGSSACTLNFELLAVDVISSSIVILATGRERYKWPACWYSRVVRVPARVAERRRRGGLSILSAVTPDG
jgi:hypothetical protein